MSESSAVTAAIVDTRPTAPPLIRRMAAFLYEGVLLFGVLFTLSLVYFGFTHQNAAAQTHAPLMMLSFLVLGAYFIHFWTRGGQTLAQKTWHLRVVTDAGGPLSPKRALARYLAAWVWFVPPYALIYALGIHGSFGWYFGLPAAWVALYAFSSFLHPRRQFWHDALCDTAIVTRLPAAPLPQ